MEAFLDLVKDIWDFMKVRKKYWLAPLIITIVLMGALIVLTPRSGRVPGRPVSHDPSFRDHRR